jgi:putative glycerol-1-phosphate prenyltransferase
MAGEMLGMNLIFMDAGSGAQNHVPLHMISAVSESIDIPLIVGGGIRTAQTAKAIASAGADVVVVGNVLEKSLQLLGEISDAVHSD